MKEFIGRVFRIYPGEMRLVLIMGFLLLSNDMARQTSGIVGISDFLDEGGINQILLVKAIDGVLIILTSALASLFVDRFNRIQLLRWTAFTFALVFILLGVISFVVPAWLSAAILFIMSQQQWLIFPLIFWVLGNDIFNMAQTKRLFPVIGSWSFVGKVLGIGVALAPAFALRFGIGSYGALTFEMVVIFNTAIYLLAFLLITVGLGNIELRKTTQRKETLTQTLTEGAGFARQVPSFGFLALGIVALMIIDLITEFRLFVVTKTAIPDAVEYQRFYSLYLLAAAVLSFLVQSFLTVRIIDKMQLKDSFLLTPLVALGSVLVMIIWPGFFTVVGSVLILKIFRNTLDSTTRKSFQALVPAEFRGRVSLFMDNYLPATGTILGCIFAGIVVFVGILTSSTSYFYIYLAIAAVAGVVQLWAIFRMRAVYDSSMLNWRLKRRGRRGLTGVMKKLDI